MRKMLILAGFCLCTIASSAETWYDEDTGYTWTYFIVDGHAEIGSSNDGYYYWRQDVAVTPSPTGDLVVPNKFGDYPVTVLRAYALSGCYITSVTLPATLTEIGDYAFSQCTSLKTVNIPESVGTIGREAFYCCRSLTAFTIPENVKVWYSDCINGCSSLKDLRVLSWNAPSGYSYGYGNGSGLTNLTIRVCSDEFPFNVSGSYEGMTLELLPGTDCSIPANYMSWSHWFYYLNLVIGEGIVKIGSCAFQHCELSELHLPNSLRIIEDSAFERAFWFSRYPYTFSLQLNKGLESIGENAFGDLYLWRYGQDDVKIQIPNTVTNIGYCAFGRSTLKDISLEFGNDHLLLQDGILYYHEIGRMLSVLMASTQLSGSLKLVDSIVRIQKGAFSGCKNITDIEIPPNVTELPDFAFSQCSGVTNLVIHRNVQSISPLSLRGVDIAAVKVHIANPNYYVNGDVLCKRLSSGDSEIVVVSAKTLDLVIPDEIISIGSEACVPGSAKVAGGRNWYSVTYASQSGIQSIVDWNNVASIGDWAFSFTSLYDLYLPENVCHIGDYSFAWCRSLRNAVIRTPIGYRCLLIVPICFQ